MPNIYIFECSDETEGECFERGLFGTNAAWPLNRVLAGDTCFLFNFFGRRQMIYGVYVATCDAAPDIVRDAWAGRFRKQVRVKQSSRERVAVPRGNIERIVTDPSTGRVRNILFGNQAQELLDYFAGGYARDRRVGNEMDRLEEDFRQRYPKEIHCADGHDVRSRGEYMIDEWLSAHIVKHDYERLTNIPEHLIPDFTVYTDDGHPVFIEFWGMLDNPDYVQRRLRKCEVYHRHRCELIELYDDDLKNLDFCLRANLKAHNVSFS